MYRILIADPLAVAGLDLLRQSGAEVVELAADRRGELEPMIPDFDALVVRSGTQVTAAILNAGSRLRVVGRAGIGVDNVDVAKATELGILVVNAPTANLISATEHTWALMLAMARNVPAADRSIKSGRWERKRFIGQELMGKTLGVIGFGRIGQNVASRGRAFEMRVLASDPFIDASVADRWGVEMATLEELLASSDIVTLHVPLADATRGLIGVDELAKMKPTAMLVNCARGGVVNEEALIEALDAGRLAAAALDVFATEPPVDNPLTVHEKVVATPHIGAQTHEAQERVATETAKMVLAALDGSLAITAVNLPFGAPGTRGEPFLQLSDQLGRLAGQLLDGGATRLELELWGIDDDLRTPITVAAIKGVLTPHLGDAVNFVNAEGLAKSRGIEVVRSTHQGSTDYPHLVSLRLTSAERTVELSGAVFASSDSRVVRFAGYTLEFRPGGVLLFLENRDVPGVVGKLGTCLGQAGVNIAAIHLARDTAGREGRALSVLQLDQVPTPEVLATLQELAEVEYLRLVDLR